MNKENLKKNFYLEVNQEWLAKAKIPNDKPGTGAFEEVDRKLEKRKKTLFKEWSQDENKIPNNPTLKEMIKFYNMVSNWETRDKLSVSPIKEIIKEINNKYHSFKDLANDYENLILKGWYLPLEFGIYNDFKDSTKQILWLGSPSIILPDTTYYSNEEKANKIFNVYEKMCTYFLLKLDYSLEEAKNLINKAINFDKKVAAFSLSREESANYAKLYNLFSIEETKNKFEFLNIKKIAENLTHKNVLEFSIENPKYLENFNFICKEENFQEYKAKLILSVILLYAPYLSNEEREISGTLGRFLSGIDKPSKPEKASIIQTLKYFGMPFGIYYGQKYFGEKGKNDVIKMVKNMVKIYQERLTHNTWLSEETKRKAILKLEKLGIYVGYPDIYKPYYDQFKVKTYEENSNLIENIINFDILINKYVFSQYLEPVNKKYWSMSPAMVNAYYNPIYNHIVFPAAIFDDPFYSIKRSSSANYGAIGAIIAHEISHGFDNNGALFDENGNLKNWWTEEDKTNFDLKTQKMIDLFDKVPTSVGECNGKLVVSENIADAGGIRCAYEAAKLEKDFNPQDFFISWATQWRSLYKDEYQKMLLVVDVHAPTILRANQQIKNMDEFYEVFNVKENDEMYISPEKRVKIW